MSIRVTAIVLAALCLLVAGCSDDGDTPAEPEPAGPLSLSESSVFVDYYDGGGEFTINNTGDLPFSWTAASNRIWLQLSAESGDLDPGGNETITLTVDRDDLATGTHTAWVTVSTDASDDKSVEVTCRNYDEDIVIVDFVVLDAEYDDDNEVWVAVSQSPSQLHVIDAVEKTVESVSLSVAPSCVSVRPDGAFAAVGHDGWITRVNLATLSAESPVQTTVDANDVVLAQDDYAHVFPTGSGWDNLRSVELPSGNETQDQELIYRGMIARLHPAGTSIYAADNGISPSDVEKFDVSSGAAVYRYDSPYHGDHAFSGNLWFSSDGSKFMARSGNVFSASTDSLSDMIYSGSIDDVDLVRWAVQSPASARWYVAHTNWLDEVSNEVRIYDDFLQYESSVTVPDVPNLTQGLVNQFSSVQARYLAVNNTGAALHVVGRRQDADVWAVGSIELTQ